MLNLDAFRVVMFQESFPKISIRKLQRAFRTAGIEILMRLDTVVSPVVVLRMDHEVVVSVPVREKFNVFFTDIAFSADQSFLPLDSRYNPNFGDFHPTSPAFPQNRLATFVTKLN